MPTFGVVVAVVDGGRIALQLREDSRLWSLPGGAVDLGESLVKAAVREVREETGLEVQLTRLVGVYSRPKWLGGGDHNVLFAAVPVGGDVHGYAEAETLDAAFFDPAKLPESLVWWHRRMIADAVSGACGVAWVLNATWPFDEDRRSVVERMRHDPTLRERVRAMFTARPDPEDERLELRPVTAEDSSGS